MDRSRDQPIRLGAESLVVLRAGMTHVASTPARLSRPSPMARTSLTLWSRRFTVLDLCYEGLFASLLDRGKRLLIIRSRFVKERASPTFFSPIISCY